MKTSITSLAFVALAFVLALMPVAQHVAKAVNERWD